MISLPWVSLFGVINKICNGIVLRANIKSYPVGIKINGRVYIKNKGVVRIGNNCVINSGKRYNIIGGDTRCNFIVEKNSELIIGSNVGISNSTFVCKNQITIEDNVLIGGGCKIYDWDFHSTSYAERMFFFNNGKSDESAKKSPVLIKKGAWIGGHCIILKGVTIGKNSIIGAGGVVSCDVPSNEIWIGNPARFVKKLLEG